MPTHFNCQQCDALFTAIGKADAITAGLSAMLDCAPLDPNRLGWMVEMLTAELAQARAAVGMD